MALKYTSKTNNKHTCQILAAVVKYIRILLREPEHMHNYAKILIGFQLPSYSRWISTSTGLPMSCRGSRSGLTYVCCHSIHSSRCPAALAVQQLPGWYKEESTKRRKQVWGRAQLWAPLIWLAGGGLHEAFVGCWTTLSAVLPGCSGCAPGRSVHGAEMSVTGLHGN